MKKLYGRKGTVHPSPPIISDHLSFLPAAILTLTAALSPEDREVLAYLLSCSNNNSSNSSSSSSSSKNTHQRSSVSFGKSKSTGSNSNNINDHPPLFTCDCFRCYMSYWVKWDASPNRQLIHEIIDAFEDHELLRNNKKAKNNKKDKKKRSRNEKKNDHQLNLEKDQQLTESELVEETSSSFSYGGDDDHEGSNNKGEGEGKGSVRSFVSFIGEKIWGVWG